ncbi:hypothetical protein A8L34_14060 [Bacillus sp. FJAT-27264]|nr:hypothetical protein A8L34_14060 [Bacillus sp. FJAT-27264]
MSADDTLAGTNRMSDDEISAQGTTRAELDMFFADVYERYRHIEAGGNYWMIVNRMKHMGFSDMYLHSPLFEWMLGVHVNKAYQLINDYTLDFFNHYLKLQPSRLLDYNIGVHSDFSLEKGS